MKVLLVSENRNKENIRPYPIGISYVSQAAKLAGHNTRGLDLMFSKDPAFDLRKEINDFLPQCIGLSIRNIDNQDVNSPTFYLSEALDLVQTIKKETAVPIIAGGAGFTILPYECLLYLGIGMGIVGEAEGSFPLLLKALEGKRGLDGIPGLVMLSGDEGEKVKRANFESLRDFPGSDFDSFDVAGYEFHPNSTERYAAGIQSRRGCPLHCIYCPNPVIEGTKIRMRSTELVGEELEILNRKHGIRTVTFTDALFHYPPDYCEALCKEIIKRSLSIRWTCSINPFRLETSLIPLMKEAGCFQVSLGNESGSDEILDALKKGFSKKDIEKAVSCLKRSGIAVNCFLLLGGPKENLNTVTESIEFMEKLAPEMVSVTAGIRIYPGCELHEISIKEGVVKESDSLLEPKFYVSKDVKPWLYERMLDTVPRHRGWKL
ncbi:MAG: radical SAM protein [Actinomycetota bacterium]|nr:radical SAM protein [Actinomycetota bacterium]